MRYVSVAAIRMDMEKRAICYYKNSEITLKITKEERGRKKSE
jgi:hypothetical protein